MDPATLLRNAKSTIDGTEALHFTLTSENAKGSGLVLSGGEGDARRKPDAFTGTLTVTLAGAPLTVRIVSVGGTFYAQEPFATHYKVATPQQYGFGDPTVLLNPDKGLSSLLVQAKNPQLGDQTRYQGEALQQVKAQLPGQLVANLLVSADPSQDVSAVFGIDPSNNQLRTVDLVGPFFAKGENATFHLVLADYGENVTITPPPTG